MQREMPQRYWRHLPEANEIDALLREGTGRSTSAICTAPVIDRRLCVRLRAVSRTPGPDCAARRVAPRLSPVPALATRYAGSRGEGQQHAAIMLVGEQPGDEEDLRGRPFVGPAGRLLDDVLRDAEVDRSELYITNAVKHFKWEPRGKRRLAQAPESAGSAGVRIVAGARDRRLLSRASSCALGATAIHAVTGLAFSVEDARHSPLNHSAGATVIATYHPSAILRADDGRKAELTRALRDDLRRAQRLAAAS